MQKQPKIRLSNIKKHIYIKIISETRKEYREANKEKIEEQKQCRIRSQGNKCAVGAIKGN